MVKNVDIFIWVINCDFVMKQKNVEMNFRDKEIQKNARTLSASLATDSAADLTAIKKQ